ncbi:hypothetical protein C4D60_Mb01t30950 [Musa balbisiana]|uniref:Anaphase-promoting complex subunit 4-like WD40 domain-containing protein n=1 Tax=Musa balbisiana TaxID=52838 RepID=A0A4S8JRZ8_MUSBA|nr:hypothetical protein C4D60_Mb01t30950 [Musa balbisiana]
MASSRSRRVEYDRFIPFRSAMDMDFARCALTMPSRPQRDGSIESPSSAAYQKLLVQCILKNRTRIFAFKSAPESPADKVCQFDEDDRPHKKQQRRIPKDADRVLAAYDIIDDDRLNLLDWGSNNVLAIGLNDTVHLWNAANKSGTTFSRALEDNSPVTSISWSPDGKVLAVALGNSDLDLVDAATGRVLVGIQGDSHSFVCSLAWRSNAILTTGRSDGSVVDYDIRKDDRAICDYKGHRLEVCSLKWSELFGRYLASGGKDKLVHIWDARMAVANHHPCQHQLLHKISNHTSTFVRCCGTKTKSELLTSNGFPNNQLTLWNYTSMTRKAELFGHSSRVLYLAGSPLGGVVASAAEDETLKFWNVFETPKPPKPEANTVPFAQFSVIR